MHQDTFKLVQYVIVSFSHSLNKWGVKVLSTKCGRQNTCPREVEPCSQAMTSMLHCTKKEALPMGLRVKTLRWGDSLNYPDGPNLIPFTELVPAEIGSEEEVTMKEEQRNAVLLTWKEGSHGSKSVRGPQKLEKARKQILSKRLQKGTRPAGTVIWGPRALHHTSDQWQRKSQFVFFQPSVVVYYGSNGK